MLMKILIIGQGDFQIHRVGPGGCIVAEVLETGGQGRGANAPPLTFAKISPKLLQNMGFSLKFLYLAPHF